MRGRHDGPERVFQPLKAGQIPYKLLDAKAALRKLRTKISADFKLGFSDLEIAREFQPSEIPDDLSAIIDSVGALFPEASTPEVAQPTLLQL